MKLRTFARTLFVIGALSVVMALVLKSSRDRAASDREFLAATTVVTDENFDEVVLASDRPVVVDVYGDHCVVCRRMEPKLLALLRDSDSAVLARANVPDVPELIERYEVRQVPTLLVIHRGELLFHGAGPGALPPMQAVLEAVSRGKAL